MKKKVFLLFLLLSCFICQVEADNLNVYHDEVFPYTKVVLIDDMVWLIDTRERGEGLYQKAMLKKASVSFMGSTYYTQNKYRWSEEDVLTCPQLEEKYPNIECPSEGNHVGISASGEAARMWTKTRGASRYNSEDVQEYANLTNTRTEDEDKPYEFEVKIIGSFAFDGCTTLREITIPESVESIWCAAFRDCSNLTQVTIPESVEYIGPLAFSGCTSLKSIKIPASVKMIDVGAFRGCSSLESVEIPETVSYLGEDVFAGCTSLSSVVLRAPVDKVSSGLFSGCTSLKSINIPNTVKYIDIWAFEECNNLETVQGAENIDSINFRAFGNCYKLENIPVYNNLKEIKDEAFSQCEKLKKFTFPNTLVKIGADAFAACDLSESSFGDQMTLESIGEAAFISTKLSSFNIPNTVVSVGSLAFANCYDLKSVTLSSKMTSLEDKLFARCFSLETITIPSNIKTIGYGIFEECNNLTSVISYITEPMAVESFTQYSSLNATLYVPTGTRRLYLNKMGWEKYPLIREGDGTWPENAITFADSKNETICLNSWDTNDDGYLSYEEAAVVETLNCSFPSSITSFDEISYFTGLKEIGENAFNGCKNLTSIAIPNSVTTIGSSAFRSCSSLTSVTIPDGVTTISEKAFFYCSGLTSLLLGNSLTSIGNGAFEGCSSLTIVDIPSGVTTIGEEAFWNCTGLTTITIPKSVNFIGDYAFENCDNLNKVNISDIAAWCNISFGESNSYSNPLNSAHHLFLNGEEVTNLVIPEGVTSIGANAFVGCNSLTSVTIPSSVTSIGELAFFISGKLNSIYSHIAEPFEFTNMFSIFRDAWLNATLYVPVGKRKIYIETKGWKQFTKIKEMGDVNGDKIVDDKDVNAIAKHIVGNTPENFDKNAAHVNCDQKIDVVDIVELNNQLYRKD